MQIKAGCFSVNVSFSTNGIVIVKGFTSQNGKGGYIYFYAANPAEKRASFSGSSFPFPNATIAFSPGQKGKVHIGSSGDFTIAIKMPNTYYASLGSIPVPPTIYLSLEEDPLNRSHMEGITLSQSIPYRKLTYPADRRNVMFYDSFFKLPVRGQEAILRSGAYPKEIPIDSFKERDFFWGQKPPV